jgi:hypothetical protein
MHQRETEATRGSGGYGGSKFLNIQNKIPVVELEVLRKAGSPSLQNKWTVSYGFSKNTMLR